MKRYDLIVVGSSFASSFFLESILKEMNSEFRVLVLELGEKLSHSWQVKNHRHSNINNNDYYKENSSVNRNWVFTLGFGGSSNCWSACTPRLLEDDFNMSSKFGVGVDWPINYRDIEAEYTYVEGVMGVSGPSDWDLSFRSKVFPQPAHKMSSADNALKEAFPRHYYPQACARPTVSVGNRPACCSSAVCEFCPVDSKFTVINSMKGVYDDHRVTLLTKAEARSVIISNGRAKGVRYKVGSHEAVAYGDTVALGANAIFNPAMLMRSGYQHKYLGNFLHEQVSKSYYLDLKELESFNGSTLISGQGYMFYEGVDRSQSGACLTESVNIPIFKMGSPENWRKRIVMKFIVEDLPLYRNRVELIDDIPTAIFEEYSDYGLNGLAKIPNYIEKMMPILGVENVHDLGVNNTEAHIQGTVRMGSGVEDSVLDSYQRLHEVENLFVLGSSSFPTGAPVNPTLTLAALSVRSAKKYVEYYGD